MHTTAESIVEKGKAPAHPNNCFLRFTHRLTRNIRISVNMLRSVWYIGAIGLKEGYPIMTKELAAVFGVLVAREVFAWLMAQQISQFYKVVNALVAGGQPDLKEFLGKFFGAAFLYAFICALEAYARGLLSLKMRHALTDWFQTLYFERLRITAPQQPPLIDNSDQRMTEDIREASKSFVDIFTVLLAQPPLILFYMIYAYSLYKWSPLALLVYFLMASGILRMTMNPVLKYTSRSEQLEADFRLVHVLAKNRAEAIAISDGGQIIKMEAEQKFVPALDVQRRLVRLKTVNNGFSMFFNYTNVIWAYSVVFVVCGSGQFAGGHAGEVSAKASLIASRLLDALSKLAMITDLFSSLPVASAHALRLIELARRLEQAGFGPDHEIPMQEVVVSPTIPSRMMSSTGSMDAVSVCFESVDLYCPNEQLLVYGFSVKIWPGQNVLIAGPSGSGKSSLIRCLAGLLKCRHGSATVLAPPGLSRPPIMYAPQVPVIVSGTILDQLYYPKAPPHFCRDDPEALEQQYDLVKQCLSAVSMYRLFVQRLNGSIDFALSSSEWHCLMSPGELQRLVIARFFLHRPVFAVLDEASNAVDLRMEQEIYELLWAAGITTISVSHRSGFVRDSASICISLDGQGNHQVELK